MKKIVLFLLVAVVAAGAVWGQTPPPAPGGGGLPVPTPVSVIDNLGLGDFFVVPVVSTESRYSAGIFSAYADDYMWFTGYDPKVGTFFLLGGYPQTKPTGTDGVVDNTDYQSDMTTTKVSFGFAKSFNKGYLGVYFGGHLVEANGDNNGLKGEEHVMTSSSTWENNFAILYGNENIGGVRFDISYESTQYAETDVDGKPTSSTVTSAPKIGLGWGKTLANEMEVYAQLGFQFPDMTVATDPDDSDKKDTTWGNSAFALQAGIYKPLASTDVSESSFSVDLLIRNDFGAKGEGDYLLKDNEYVNGGTFKIGVDAGIKQVVKADEKLSFGFKPNLAIGFSIDDTSSKLKGSEETVDAAKTVLFELAAGVNLGVKYQISQKFSLYTGVGFNLLSWKAASYSQGKDQKYDEDEEPNLKSSAWEVKGINPRYETLHGSPGDRLGFGLTFTPTKNIVIGAGINSFLDNIFYFDVGKMQLGTGFSQSSPDQTELGWIGANLIGNLTFDLTISVKF